VEADFHEGWSLPDGRQTGSSYERIGVLPCATRTESGYRVYPPTAVERVNVVQRALLVGFSLAELAEVLKARDSGGAPCQPFIS
jgi:DNA-binding transcriptional MerR regulator